MNKRLLALLSVGLVTNPLLAINVIEPQEVQNTTIRIADPDRHIRTLGEVAFRIDLSAAHDDLLALKVRRSDLRLNNGRVFTAFGVHKKAGLVVLAGGDVTHVSIASVENSDAHVLFYGQGNQVISPRPEDVAVFDTNFKPLGFTYTPLQTPGSLDIPISIALDTSGSMDGHMATVVNATRDFMRELPKFTRCQLLTFDDDVTQISTQASSCPSSAYLLNRKFEAGGATALYKAIHTGFASTSSMTGNFPNITIVVTDGVNTVDYYQTLEDLKVTKASNNAKLFVFWAGSHEQGYLQGLADLEFVSTANLKSELDRFFHSLGVSLSGLQTLHIRRP